jgi:pantetheine-phosphate adenylyltransferase
MARIALFPGSFDPITLGHVDIIERALPLFDEIRIAVGTNSSKNHLFSLEQRIAWIEETFTNEPKIKVVTYDGLTVDFAQQEGVNFLLRGIRESHCTSQPRDDSRTRNDLPFNQCALCVHQFKHCSRSVQLRR